MTLCDSGVHYARLDCAKCGRFKKWITKPDSDPTKYRRPQLHQDLAGKYGRGFCELCLCQKDDLPKGRTLEAQHVIEFKDGGGSERENIWIVCTGCQRLIHWVRTYRA
jgi:5-methylcytosine-specific restriction endonuclease McrA